MATFHHKPRSKKQQISPEMLIYMVSETILTKKGSISFTLYPNCKHSLSFKTYTSSLCGSTLVIFPLGRQRHCTLTVAVHRQGVVTYIMSCVEEFSTGPKLNEAIKTLFESRPKDQGSLQTERIKMHSYNLTFDPLAIKIFKRE